MINLWILRKLTNVCKSVRKMSTTNCKVYIYDGEGASDMSKIHLKRSLQENLSTRYDVKFISPDDIIKGTWARDAALMAFGGGFDKGFIRTLGTAGVENIRSYVINGGKYLGICAGGYFGCDHIEFDKGGPLQVCGERHLKFFPGCGQGPVYPGFKYNDLVGSRAAPIDFQTSSSSREIILTYFYGGGCFLLNDSGSSDLKSIKRLDQIRRHLDHSHQNFDSDTRTDDPQSQSYARTSKTTITHSHKTTNLSSRADTITSKTADQNSVGDGEVSETVGDSNSTTNQEVKYPKTGLSLAAGNGSDSGALNPNHDILENDRLLPENGHDTTDPTDTISRNSKQTSVVADVEILSRYCELSGSPPAIVKCQVGEGRAILCGVHIEYIPRVLLEMEPTLKNLVKTLENTEKQRLNCFRSLLQQLDLGVKKI